MYGSTLPRLPLSALVGQERFIGPASVYRTCCQASVSYGMCVLALCSKSSQGVLLNRRVLLIELWKDREDMKQSDGGRQQGREKKLERGQQASRAVQPGATRSRKCCQ